MSGHHADYVYVYVYVQRSALYKGGPYDPQNRSLLDHDCDSRALGFQKDSIPPRQRRIMGIKSVFLSASRRHVLIAHQMELLDAIVSHIGMSLYFSRDVRHIPEVTVKCAP